MTASAFQQITVQGPTAAGTSAPGTQLVEAGAGAILLYNADPENTVWLSGSPYYTSADAGTPFVVPLAPQQQIVFNGAQNIYGVCAAGESAEVDCYPTALATTAVSLGQVQLPTGFVPDGIIGPLGSDGTALISVESFQSVDLVCAFNSASAVTAGCAVLVPLVFSWYADAAGAILVSRDSGMVWVGFDAAYPVPAFISNKCKAAYLAVTVFNPGTVSDLVVNLFSLMGSDRSLSNSVWSQPLTSQMSVCVDQNSTAVMPDAFYPPGIIPDGILAQVTNYNIEMKVGQYYVPFGLFDNGQSSMNMRFYIEGEPYEDPVVSIPSAVAPADYAPGTAAPGIVWHGSDTAQNVEELASLNCARTPYALLLSLGTPDLVFSVESTLTP